MKRADTFHRRRELREQLRALSFEPLMRGSIVERVRVCGKPACGCARDRERRHRGMALSVHLEGRTRTFHLRPDDLDRVRRATGAYGRLWEIVNELTALELGLLRTEARKRRRRDG